MRANIAGLPDGTYSYDDFLDNDGVTDAPLSIALDLTISGDRMRLDFSRSSPPCDGPLNIALSTTVACCYVALKHIFTDVPANAGCLAPIEFVDPEYDAARRLRAAAGRRLYRDDPARHRHGVRRVCQGRAATRQWQSVRHHQCALARRLARAWPALGDVLLFRRRARRQSGERRAQPRQQPDLDRDHSAGGNPGIAVSRAVHAMGAAARFRWARLASRRARRDLRNRGAGARAAPMCSCLASGENSRHSASTAASRAALNRFVYQTDAWRGASRRSSARSPMSRLRRPARAAGDAGWRRIRRSA